MRSKTSGSTFSQSRAVEEPLEATMKLGEDIQSISRRALTPLGLGIVAFIILIILLVPSIYDILTYLLRGLLGSVDFTSKKLQNTAISGITISFLMAIIITAMLYMSQINKFVSVNLLKCCNITDLTEVRPSDKSQIKKGKIRGKHLKNPIFAVLDLEEESMHVLPQIIKMLRFCVFFVGIAMFLLLMTIILKLAFDFDLLFSFGIIRMGLGVLLLGKFLIILVLLMQAESGFKYIHTRHKIIDSIRFEKNIGVPEGKDPILRLITHLKDTDPYIRSSHLADKKEFSHNITLRGASGKEHVFDGYFSGTNILKEKSVALGMPMGKFGVFIKVFMENITLSSIRSLRDSAMDVCESKNMFPLRIIALQWSVSDLPDDVYEYVLEDPVISKNMQTHIEIIAEDGEIYSFIPMISYGEG